VMHGDGSGALARGLRNGSGGAPRPAFCRGRCFALTSGRSGVTQRCGEGGWALKARACPSVIANSLRPFTGLEAAFQKCVWWSGAGGNELSDRRPTPCLTSQSEVGRVMAANSLLDRGLGKVRAGRDHRRRNRGGRRDRTLEAAQLSRDGRSWRYPNVSYFTFALGTLV
jgi:hypothetical protein